MPRDPQGAGTRVAHDTQATDEIVCPHCGYEHIDSFEHHRDHQGMPLGIKTECGKCDQSFEFDVEYTPTYWSRPIPPHAGEETKG